MAGHVRADIVKRQGVYDCGIQSAAQHLVGRHLVSTLLEWGTGKTPPTASAQPSGFRLQAKHGMIHCEMNRHTVWRARVCIMPGCNTSAAPKNRSSACARVSATRKLRTAQKMLCAAKGCFHSSFATRK